MCSQYDFHVLQISNEDDQNDKTIKLCNGLDDIWEEQPQSYNPTTPTPPYTTFPTSTSNSYIYNTTSNITSIDNTTLTGTTGPSPSPTVTVSNTDSVHGLFKRNFKTFEIDYPSIWLHFRSDISYPYGGFKIEYSRNSSFLDSTGAIFSFILILVSLQIW